MKQLNQIFIGCDFLYNTRRHSGYVFACFCFRRILSFV